MTDPLGELPAGSPFEILACDWEQFAEAGELQFGLIESVTKHIRDCRSSHSAAVPKKSVTSWITIASSSVVGVRDVKNIPKARVVDSLCRGLTLLCQRPASRAQAVLYSSSIATSRPRRPRAAARWHDSQGLTDRTGQRWIRASSRPAPALTLAAGSSSRTACTVCERTDSRSPSGRCAACRRSLPPSPRASCRPCRPARRKTPDDRET